MKQKTRMYAMVLCLILISGLFMIWSISESLVIKELAILVTMFLGGYAFRDTLEPKGQKEE